MVLEKPDIRMQKTESKKQILQPSQKLMQNRYRPNVKTPNYKTPESKRRKARSSWVW